MINRTKNAKLNILVSLLVYFVQLFLSMIVRLVFIQKLGAEYLGLNGVLTSTLSMLSVVDLGLDSIFVYSLFKPLYENNTDLVKSIMKLYRNTFRCIAVFILIIGSVLTLFLPDIVGSDGMKLKYVYIIYFLFLANSVGSYLLSYYRSILNANQQGYIVNGLTSASFIVISLVQLYELFQFSGPVLYVLIQLIGTLSMNFVIMLVARHYFPYLSEREVKKLPLKERNKIFKNSVGGFSSKIGSLVVFGSDNIILSVFSSLSIVGIYSNYVVITNAVQTIIQKISISITPSVGHLGVENDFEKNRKIFSELVFSLYTLVSFVYGIFITLLHPFMILWVGKKFVFSPLTELLIAIVLILQLVRVPFWIYIDAFGLQWVQRWKSVFEAMVNLALTLLFVWFFDFGINGVLFGTILSTVITVLWIEPFVVYKYPLNSNFSGIGSLLVRFGIVIIIQTTFHLYISHLRVPDSLIFIVIHVLASLIVWALLIFVIFFRTGYFSKVLIRLRR